jgi:ADP-dependent NAD(P)H-hydrate dehydratase / NAD(P)H-hydrate epimerase
MIRAHTVEQVRAAEGGLIAALPQDALMQRAAHGLAHAVLELLGEAYGRRVLLLVGPGDNGGDALYAGAVLARRGVQVTAWPVADRHHERAAAALRLAGGVVVDSAPAVAPDLLVDGVVGIGGRPGLTPPARAALAAFPTVPVVAVDLPSGVDADTGETTGIDGDHVEALLTVTFGTHRVAHLVDPAATACGVVHLVDLGLELPEPAVEALRPADVAQLLPRPGLHAQKYTRGVVGVRSGSEAYPGAGLLSVAGASCGLAGMVRYVGDRGVLDLVRHHHPEVVGGGRVQAWVVGSGSGDGAAGTLAEALDDDVPVVVDADALAHAPRGRADTILTPHAGELARMLGVGRDEVEDRPLDHAQRAAETYGCVVLLKGRRTLVVHPDGGVRATTTGTPWLATAGAGDVLGGVVAALAAAGLTPYDAASVGAWLHGAAATRAAAAGPIVAGDVARALPATIAAVLAPGSDGGMEGSGP